jgi:PEGA domain
MIPRSPHDPGRIVVANDYQWIGDPRVVGFTVYVNGRRAGVAPLGEALSAQVDPGTHVVRVRLWWFLSPRVTVSVNPGETVRFSADRPRTLPWWRQLRGLVDPFHWLSLDRTGNT